MMKPETIKERLKELHRQEDELNKQIGKFDKTIRHCQKQKLSISKRVSKNMRYRNELINKL